MATDPAKPSRRAHAATQRIPAGLPPVLPPGLPNAAPLALPLNVLRDALASAAAHVRRYPSIDAGGLLCYLTGFLGESLDNDCAAALADLIDACRVARTHGANRIAAVTD